MANEQMMTIRGRMVGDPELRFTPSGSAVVNFTIAANARTFDKNTNEWKDKDAIFWRCSAWRELAENIAETLTKGMAVLAFVELESRSYDKDGEKRTVTEAKVEAIGPDLRWASAKVTRTARGNGEGAANRGGGNGGGFGGTATNGSWTPDGGSSAGAWNAPATSTAGGWGTGAPAGGQEPPF
ncbi:single-stranded DNA-binding protein [Arthrobacter sp. AQ5-05]|uniref:single-stranded DNA-binding protein n=1 Tax=Arthrobacter sp. AQ5-05 TaxID=2184581 RepID=UPI000DCE282B|nr:single-stranded DNA-binding protein [Arthrobacter sp. AQ5-05]RAX50893.1 single-stranded DNA-binding protein [Arthrobacter sp. AQ5-05]